MSNTNESTVTRTGLGDRVLRCGAVGVGRMGRHHARTYANMPGVELVGVVDGDTDRAASVAENHNTRVFESVTDLVRAGVDAVSVAVPTTAHRVVTEELLEAGVACLVEKPLAGDVEEAGAIKETADRTGSILMVGHIERFNPIIRALRKAQGEHEPVVPRFIEVHRVSPMTFRSVDVGVVMDMMIHDLDVMLMLMDGAEPVDVQASGVPVLTEHEDICNARLTFDRPNTGQCVVNITASRLALKTERITRITGENAYIRIDYAAKTGTVIRRVANQIQMEEVREQLRRGIDLTDLSWSELVNIEPLVIDDSEPIVMEIESFLDAVRTGRQPEIDATAGFVNVRTAERIVAAARADWAERDKTTPAESPSIEIPGVGARAKA